MADLTCKVTGTSLVGGVLNNNHELSSPSGWFSFSAFESDVINVGIIN